MAVTGTGTQADPFIVHDYWELKSVCDSTTKNTGVNYVNLANDIDCNDYGDSFEWESLKLSTFSRAGSIYYRYYIDFDMCGHTIKNILIKANNKLFEHTQNSVGEGVKIRNGKLLNIFNNGIEYLVHSSTWECPICFDNVSMSINTNGITNVDFNAIKMNKCAIYLDGNMTADIIRVNASNVCISNSDFIINGTHKNKPAGGTTYFAYNQTNGQFDTVSNCRIRGNMIFKGGFCNFARMSNCVVDVPMWMGSYGAYASPFIASGNNTGVVNADKVHDQNGNGEGYWNENGMTRVTDTELKSAAALQAKGFNVVKVG